MRHIVHLGETHVGQAVEEPKARCMKATTYCVHTVALWLLPTIQVRTVKATPSGPNMASTKLIRHSCSILPRAAWATQNTRLRPPGLGTRATTTTSTTRATAPQGPPLLRRSSPPGSARWPGWGPAAPAPPAS